MCKERANQRTRSRPSTTAQLSVACVEAIDVKLSCDSSLTSTPRPAPAALHSIYGGSSSGGHFCSPLQALSLTLAFCGGASCDRLSGLSSSLPNEHL